jgi:xanthine dehydrogenase accessory factor
MNAETARAGLSLLEAGEGFAWVTILETKGSSPRHSGAAMVVRADGAIAGTIGGGPLEAAIIQRAVDAVGTRRSSVEGFDSAELGMRCGGGGHVLVEYVDPARAEMRELFLGLVGLLEGGRRGWLVTVVPEGGVADTPVRRCLVGSDGSISGDVVSDPETLRALPKRGGTYDALLAPAPASTYVDLVGSRGSAYVFGAGHCGEKLVPVLTMLGFFTVVVDDRADFATGERFPTADRIVVPDSFDGVVPSLPIDHDSHVIIVTRGHAHDTDILRQTLRTQAAYIGMIGSRKKVADAFRTLEGEGVASADLARVHAPIGLSIGAETPEEIAISIAAELIHVRAAESR